MVHLVPNVQTLAGQDIGAIRLAPTTTLHFDTVLKTKYSFRHWIFLFFAKIRLEIANICCQWQLVRTSMMVSKWLKGGAESPKIQNSYI